MKPNNMTDFLAILVCALNATKHISVIIFNFCCAQHFNGSSQLVAAFFICCCCILKTHYARTNYRAWHLEDNQLSSLTCYQKPGGIEFVGMVNIKMSSEHYSYTNNVSF